MTFQATTETTTEGKPSTRKRRRHGAIGLAAAHLTMIQARVLAKLVARGAASLGCQSHAHKQEMKSLERDTWGSLAHQRKNLPEMNMAVRKASSCLLKKKLR